MIYLIAATAEPVLTGAASSSYLQVIGIIIASVMSALTTVMVAYFTYRTTVNQQRIDEKLKEGKEALDCGNEKLDVIHVLTNSRLTMAIRAIVALKRKAGEELTEEELAIERGDVDQLKLNVKAAAAAAAAAEKK